MTFYRQGRGAARAAVALAVVLGGLASMVTASRAGSVSPATKELLQSSSYIYTATTRKSGALSESVPIWFMYDGDRIFFTTGPESWKAKRIARGSPLTIHVGTKTGPTLVGKATKVTDPALIDRMGQAYGAKYWIAWLGLFRPRSDRVTAGKTVAYLVDLEER
jgi:PPOX class probable F420-dependent enzyme